MSVRIDWTKPAIARPIPRILPVSDLPTTPPLRMAISRYPCGARIVRSRLVPAPANTISTPGRRASISWAIEMPGYRCPPVPPPATTIVSATGGALGGMLRDVQQHPEGAQTDDQARAAVRKERQRDALRRHQAERHRHVHHRLRHEPGGNPHPEVVTAPVRRPGRRHDTAPEQHAERGDHRRGADEAQLLRNHREYEIGVRLGQEEQLLAALPDALAVQAAAGHRQERL